MSLLCKWIFDEADIQFVLLLGVNVKEDKSLNSKSHLRAQTFPVPWLAVSGTVDLKDFHIARLLASASR